MHIALPLTTNNTKAKEPITADNVAAENNNPPQSDDINSRIKLAQVELEKVGVGNAKQLTVPSIVKQINKIKADFNLGKEVEVHMHGKKAEFCEGHSHEDETKALHAPVQKKTSTCTGSHCSPEQSKPKGFFQSLFSTAA
jgi:DNA primase catalytic subunit